MTHHSAHIFIFHSERKRNELLAKSINLKLWWLIAGGFDQRCGNGYVHALSEDTVEAFIFLHVFRQLRTWSSTVFHSRPDPWSHLDFNRVPPSQSLLLTFSDCGWATSISSSLSVHTFWWKQVVRHLQNISYNPYNRSFKFYAVVIYYEFCYSGMSPESHYSLRNPLAFHPSSSHEGLLFRLSFQFSSNFSPNTCAFFVQLMKEEYYR